MDTHTLMLTTREVEMVLDALALMGSYDDDEERPQEIIALEAKITEQTGVQ